MCTVVHLASLCVSSLTSAGCIWEKRRPLHSGCKHAYVRLLPPAPLRWLAFPVCPRGHAARAVRFEAPVWGFDHLGAGSMPFSIRSGRVWVNERLHAACLQQYLLRLLPERPPLVMCSQCPTGHVGVLGAVGEGRVVSSPFVPAVVVVGPGCGSMYVSYSRSCFACKSRCMLAFSVGLR